jgi:FkbM family methyltransferase
MNSRVNATQSTSGIATAISKKYYNADLDTPERRHRNAEIYRLEMRAGLLSALRLLSRSEWLPLGARYRLASLFCRSEYCASLPFEVDFFGLRYPGDLSSFVDWHVYFFGAYEKASLLYLRDLLHERSEGVFIDIGANVGQHTLFMSKYARVVHAFEPWDVVRRSIEGKVKRNTLTNIRIHPVGLGERHEWLPYYAPLGANTGTGSFDKNHATDRNRLSGNLEIVNGDEYFEENGIRNIDLIKIDAEGWEKYVLLGLRKTLARSKPTVFMEISESTLRTIDGQDGLRRCLPECYEVVYVDIGPRGIKYSLFDASRPGNALLRVVG